jgi:hypothetical protein
MVLTWIFGPMFVAIYGFGNVWNLRNDSQEYLKVLQDTFLDTTAIFSISVAVATVVRLHQSITFFEIAFLQSLTTMQFLGLLCTSIAAGIAIPSKEKRRVWVIVLYLLVDFCFYMAVVAYLHTSEVSWTIIQQLVRACQSYGSISPGFVYASKQKPPPGRLAGIVIGSVVGFFFLFMFASSFFATAIRLARATISRLIISLAFAIGTLYCLVQLEQKRNVMKIVTGADFQDNQMGFGQVIAISLWLPLIIQSLYYIVGRIPLFSPSFGRLLW